MNSMTGYGVARHRQESLNFEISVKSVNGRFFEMRCHAPREYVSFESDIKKILQGVIRRGTVDVYVQRRKTATNKDLKITPKVELASKWIKAYRSMGRELNLENDLTMSTLLEGVSGVISVDESLQASPGEKREFLKVFNQALKKCCQERKREGKALRSELQGQLLELECVLKGIEKYRGEANDKLKARYLKRLEKLGAPSDIDPQRLAQEVVIQIDKVDICEELVRLKEHIKVFKKFMMGERVQGKKLDFYTQELLREVNTIGSKSQVPELTQLVVEAKTIVERVREQVQNVE